MKSEKSKHRPFASKAFRHGSMAILFTIIFLVVVILINVVATALSRRYPLTIDLTSDKIYTLSLTDEHEEFIKSIDQDVNIIVLMGSEDINNGTYSTFLLNNYGVIDATATDSQRSNGKYFQQFVSFLDNFGKLNSHINVQYINPLSNAFASISSKYPNEQFQYGEILVESSFMGANNTQINRFRHLTIDDIFTAQYTGQSSYYSTLSGSKLDTSIVSALYIVTSEASVKATILGGHNTQDISGLKGLLEENNYEVTTITNVLTETIPEDSEFIIIACPAVDYSSQELQTIDAFLQNNGNKGRTLFYVADYSQPSLPNLEEYLREWGIEIYNEVVYDPDTRSQFGNLDVDEVFEDSDFTQDFDNDSEFFPIVYRAVRSTFQEQGTYYMDSILTSTSACVGQPIDELQNADWKPVDAEHEGPFELIVKSTNFATLEDGTYVESSVVVCSSYAFIDQTAMASPNYVNGELSLGIFNGIAGVDRTDAVEIVPKSIQTTSYAEEIYGSYFLPTLLLGAVVVISLLIIIVGFVVWLRRKNL